MYLYRSAYCFLCVCVLHQVVFTTSTATENVHALEATSRRSMARIEQGLAGGGSRQDLARLVAAVDIAEVEAQVAREEEQQAERQRETYRERHTEAVEAEAAGVSTKHDPSDAERDAAIANFVGDPGALQALVQQPDTSVGSALDTPASRTAVAPTGSERQRDRTESQNGETLKVRMNGGWWRVPLSAPSPNPVPKTSKAATAAAAATTGSSFASRLESDLAARKDKAVAVAASRARQAQEEQQLALIPKVSKGSQRMGAASGVDALARPLEHKRSDTRRRQEVLMQQPTAVAFETPIVTANGLVLTRQNQADSRTTRALTWEAACVCARARAC